jgi:replicative DNA helicase
MIERSIFNGLLTDEEYVRTTIPYLKDEYFSDQVDKKIYHLFFDYYEKYTSLPSKDALLIELGSTSGLSDEQVKTASETIQSLVPIEEKDREWLIQSTEKFCQEKAIYNAIMDSIQIIDGRGSEEKGSIPKLLSDALSVSFDPHIGHDFIDDAMERFDFYNKKEMKIPFDIDLLNKVTKGGLSKKTLNVALAGTGVGKSLFMCHCAAANLNHGLNVLYITLEMAEEKIAERIDANLLNVTIDELKMLPRDAYEKKIERVSSKTKGKLIIKEYPTASAHAGHFRHLINELKMKKGFKPDIVYVDYLNICGSARIKGAAVNSYTYVKAIAEELRGLAVECDAPLVTATQTTRSGFTSTDVGLEDTSESFGLPATADFMFAIISSEELEDMAQVMFKQLKNRYSDPNYNKRFVVGIDRAKMRLYDVEQSAQDDIVDDGPAFDKGAFGEGMSAEKFSGFK